MKNLKKLSFTTAISGQWPCQVEGFIVATNEPYYFHQRGGTAYLKIFDKPLGEFLDKHDGLFYRALRTLSKIIGVPFKRTELPKELAMYTLEVKPLDCDAAECVEEVKTTMFALLAMHEQATKPVKSDIRPSII